MTVSQVPLVREHRRLFYVLQNISEYLDRAADRQLVEAAARACDSLKIKAPEDLQPIIDILNAKNEGREKY